MMLWARYTVNRTPFDDFSLAFGQRDAPTPLLNCSDPLRVGQIRWAILWATKLLLWRDVCLAQCLAGVHMLTRRGFPTTLYLGCIYGKEFKAHAWLDCGDITVIDKGGTDYRILAVYNRHAHSATTTSQA